MKRAAAWLLLIPILFQACGVIFFCFLMQFLIRLDLENSLQDKQPAYEHLSLTTGHYRDCLNNKDEIKIGGKLYDIRSVTIHGNIADLILFHDLREQEVLSLLEDFLNGEDNSGNFSLQLQKFLTAQYLLPKGFPESPNGGKGISLPVTYRNHFSLVVKDLATPPPRRTV